MPLRKLTDRQKVLVLFALIVVQGLSAFVVWYTRPQEVPFAYLVKQGPQFLVVWREGDSDRIQANAYPTMKSALVFASDVLGLTIGSNPVNADGLERVWIQERSGQYALLWKTARFDFLNRLTFAREAEAQAFRTAFLNGAYTAGPFGHSIFLRPLRVQ